MKLQNRKTRKTQKRLEDIYKQFIIEGNTKKIEEFQSKNTITKNINKIGLFLGAEQGNLEVVKFHLEHIEIIENEDINFIVFIAAEFGHTEILKHLVSYNLSESDNKNIAVIRAASRGHLEVVKLLKKNGADIHTESGYPIAVATQNGHLEVVKYLESEGADIFSGKCSPFEIAVRNNHKEIIRLFIMEQDKEIPNSMIESLKNIPYIESANYTLQLIETRDMAKQLESSLRVKNEQRKQRTKI